MAQDDAHRVCAPPPLVRSTGGVRLYCATSSLENSDPCGRTQSPSSWSSSTRRHFVASFRWTVRRKLAGLTQELHTATHLGGQALWKLFSDRYSHKAGRRICLEVAQSCPQCQRGSDYGHRQKTTGSIESRGPWDTLSVDIVGPLPADRRHEFIIVFVDCFSRYTVLVPASNHTADAVSDALLRHVVPYFGTPRRLLSDRGREFVGDVCGKLTHSWEFRES